MLMIAMWCEGRARLWERKIRHDFYCTERAGEDEWKMLCMRRKAAVRNQLEIYNKLHSYVRGGRYVIIQSNALCSIYTSIVKLIFETPSVSAQFSQQSRLPLKSHTSSRASVSLYQLSFLCDSSLFTPNLILITEKWLVCRNKKSFIMEFSPFLAALR